ncbi:MFS transporter [Neorhizobium sp. P12A]|nr:MFS transporter [Neorhizobium sp. P12A]KAA0689450.1 MFS transporter [Neorhizobium sp. P12A]
MSLQQELRLRRRYMTAVAASATGRNAYFVIVAWLEAAFDNGPAWIAVLLALGSIAEFLTANLSGIIADRYERRIVCLICDIARILLMITTMSGMMYLDPVAVLAVSWVVYAVIDRTHTTALQAMIPSMAAPGRLIRTNSLSYMNMQGGNLLAAIAGGLLLALFPNHLAFVLPLGFYALSFWAMLSSQIRSTCHQAPTMHRPTLWARELLPSALPAGPLRGAAVIYALIYAMGMLVSVLGSALVMKDLKGTALAFGYLEAFWAAGAIAGCAYLMTLTRRSHSLAAQLAASGCVLAIFLVVQDLNLALLQMTALGITYNISRILIDARVQELVSIDALGRGKSQIHTLCVGFGLLTYSFVAVAGNSVKPSVVFGCFGLLMIAVGAILLILPKSEPRSGGLSET